MNYDVVNVALFVRLEGKRGRQTEVEKFLGGGLSYAEKEPDVVAGRGNSPGQAVGALYIRQLPMCLLVDDHH